MAINKPRFYELVDPVTQAFQLACYKLDVDLIRMEAQNRQSGRPLWRVDLTIAETTGLVTALSNCTVMPPLPSYDYEASVDDGQITFFRTPHVRGTP